MVAAVLLAAGAGTRFDGIGHKLTADLRGRPVLAHALESVVATGLDLYVVTGALDVGGDALAGLLPEGAVPVENPVWERGQATSVQAGIAAARADGHDAVVVGLGDQPFVTAEAWLAVASADGDLVVATYAGRRGHPVKLSSRVWDLLPTEGDEVGRVVMRSRPDLVREIACDGDSADIDTLEDLHRWS